MFLINGLGIQTKDSYDIPLDKYMPTFMNLVKKGLYGKLDNECTDSVDAYYQFSNYVLENYETFVKEEEFLGKFNVPELYDKIFFSDDERLHYFVFFTKGEDLVQAIPFIKNGKGKKIIHIIFNERSIVSYDGLIYALERFWRDLTGVKDVSLGMMVGKNRIEGEYAKETYKFLVRGIGEKWAEFGKKLACLKNDNIIPADIFPFHVHDSFRICANDKIFVLNYRRENCLALVRIFLNPADVLYKQFVNFEVKDISVYSLFPMDDSIPFLKRYVQVINSNYLENFLEREQLTCTVITEDSRVSSINYAFNGRNSGKCKNITYIRLEEFVRNVKYLLEDRSSFVIIDFSIENCGSLEEIVKELKGIDEVLQKIMELPESYTLFISSLFGILRNFESVKLNLTKALPVVLVSEQYSKKKYKIDSGKTFYLLLTILYLLTGSSLYGNLIVEKSSFDKMLGK